MRCLTFLLLSLVMIQPATAWWNEDWAYRKSIGIDTAAAGLDTASGEQEFPLLLRLHSGNFGYFFDIKEAGADLRIIAADDQTPLKYHVEKLDPINGMALIWVKLPALGDAATKTIHMYYGNPAATPAADVAGTYGVNDVAVFHFDQAIAQDVTGYGNHPASFTARQNTASFIGSGAQFSGSASILLNNTPSLVLQSSPGWTFSSWFKADAMAEQQAVIIETSDGSHTLGLYQQGSDLVASVISDGQVFEARAASALTQGQWQHIGVSVQGDQLLVFNQGDELARVAIPELSIAGNISIGAGLDGSGGLVGELDELRLANVGQDSNWFKAIVASQGQAASLLSYGGDESQQDAGSGEGEAGHSGYFGIIISNVFDNDEAIVEQIVIGFCGVMAAVSFLVMFLKALLLYDARSTTKKFLSAYQGLSVAEGDLTTLRQYEKRFRSSPLFRVYAQGIDELQRRISPAVGAQFSGLEAKSLNAIRASLDASMIREGQRLNAQMVLLTIAISGGPFVGLLGTVVGVMVTFAGIAASGQVDINSIAPGMAAALLATVAGLGVAIPALFGYNYLGSQIKEVSADMHVFADELVARIGESYGR